MRILLRVALVFVALTCITNSAPLSDADLKNLLAEIPARSQRQLPQPDRE